MPEKPADLARIRAALERLETLAEERPDLVGAGPATPGAVAEWEATLEEAMKNDLTVTVRLPGDLVSRVDRFARQLEAATPGIRVSRSAAMRVLLNDALGRLLTDEGE